MGGYWAVVRTHANSERRACENLKRQDFEYYFPRYKMKRGAREFVCALFPRYMFIHIVDRWRSVLSTFGIQSVLLRHDGYPYNLSSEIISNLKNREDRNGFIKMKDGKLDIFQKGQKLIVNRGAFVNEHVIYQYSSAHDREVVLLSVLGRLTPISIDHNSLAAV